MTLNWSAILAVALGLLLAGGRASAQMPPSAAEIAAYDGLHAAAWAGDVPAIERLVASGAAIDRRDGQRRTALHIAAHARQREAMRALVRLGADPRAQDGQRYDAITIAAVADDLETLRVAIAIGGDPRAITSPYDGTALIAAAHLGHDEIVKALIEAGAPLDHVNNLAWTALIEAVILGDGGVRTSAPSVIWSRPARGGTSATATASRRSRWPASAAMPRWCSSWAVPGHGVRAGRTRFVSALSGPRRGPGPGLASRPKPRRSCIVTNRSQRPTALPA
ncbi:ankyrin repeat domain-containing protein [Bosea sp. Leaf344]|uniref:ankyrin repeat domain-containing protein n=1 Tax=Bosea sp. Leaf344 TaxID=1736346 RepID=UPI000B2034AE|nr:ankyrin repeat domain-containing protein [Bosea sp. Leaf344]